MATTVNLKINPDTFDLIREALTFRMNMWKTASETMIEAQEGADFTEEEMDRWQELNGKVLQIEMALRDLK